MVTILREEKHETMIFQLNSRKRGSDNEGVQTSGPSTFLSIRHVTNNVLKGCRFTASGQNRQNYLGNQAWNFP